MKRLVLAAVGIAVAAFGAVALTAPAAQPRGSDAQRWRSPRRSVGSLSRSQADPPDTPPDPAGPEGLRGFVFTVSMLLALALLTGWAQLPGGWAPAWFHSRAGAFDAVWPQGWSFFADAATASSVLAYQSTPAGLILVNAQVGAAENLHGLGRTPFTVESQILSIAALVPAAGWRDCAAPLADCVEAAAAGGSSTVASPAVRPTVCGPLVLARVVPSPWTGGRAPASPYTVTGITSVDVRC